MRLPRPRPTIRSRLTIAAVGVTVVMLALASIAIVTIQRRALIAGIDEALRQRADNLQPIGPSLRTLPGEGDPEDSFAQLLDRTGSVVAVSRNAARQPAVQLRAGDLAASRMATATLARPVGTYRVLVRPVRAGTETHALVVGKNLDDVSDGVRILVLTLTTVSPILALLLGILAWWLTGRTLSPVEAIRREVQEIHGDELHRRVPVPATEDEIAELARTMNAMLSRVESASARQQQFVDDASHELRTPLTRMITDLEVAVARPAAEPSSITFRRVLEHATDLRGLLQDLLYLARTSHGGVITRAEVDLDDVVLAAARDLRPRSTVTIDTTGVSAARVIGDAGELERAVHNLLDNALRHARTRVSVSTSSRDGSSEVVVDDDGSGIPVADRHRVFERFTRLDEARSRDHGGAGLGLAIVGDIARRHHGRVSATDVPKRRRQVRPDNPQRRLTADPPSAPRGTQISLPRLAPARRCRQGPRFDKSRSVWRTEWTERRIDDCRSLQGAVSAGSRR